MAEILTESFCERCGSRYTFESEVPRARLRGVKVLSRGLKNFVLDDKTSIDEAMAAARDDTDRALTSHQLEAFHKTFNFCMTCRQYICPDCWNDGEGQCLTCAPLLGRGILPAPFPNLDPSAGIAPPSEAGLAAAAMNGHGNGSAESHGLDALARLDSLTLDQAAPTNTAPEMIGTSEVEARAEEAEAAHDAEPDLRMTIVEPDADEHVDTEIAADIAAALAIAADTETPTIEPETLAADADEPGAAATVAAPEAEPELVADVVDDVAAFAPAVEDTAEPAAATAAQADLLLAGLEPGQSLDEAIAAFESQPTIAAELEEAELPAVESTVEAAVAPAESATEEPQVAVEPIDVALAAPEDVAPVAEPADAGWDVGAIVAGAALISEAESEAVAQAVEPLDEIPTGDALDAAATDEPEDAWSAEPLDELVPTEPVDLEPAAFEPVIVEPSAPEPLLEPVLVEQAPEPAPRGPEPFEIAAAAALVAEDQPGWSIVAPSDAVDDVPGRIADQTSEPIPPVAAPVTPLPTEPAAEPTWPAKPMWPSVAPSTGLPFLGRHATPTGGVEALWAASDLAVSAPRDADKPTGGVQPCVSCGLSLSASARFCRRCGTAQVA